MKSSAEYNVIPSELEEALMELTEIGQSVMVSGPPGIGKSEICAQVARKTSRTFIDIRALLLDPVELHGLPYRDGDVSKWARSNFLPGEHDQGRFLILLDELPAATPMMQAALYQLVLDHKIGEHRLPANTAVIGAGNLEEDGGEYNELSKAMASRFVHFGLKVSVEDWQSWAAFNGIATETCFFISMRPELLHKYDPESSENTFPCPRTWEFASKMTTRKHSMSPAVERATYVGTVGQGAGVEYTAFLKIWKELSHPVAIINDPRNIRIPENPSVLIATCGSLERFATEQNFDAVVTFAGRLRPEIGQFLIGQTVARNPKLQQTRAFVQWASKVNR